MPGADEGSSLLIRLDASPQIGVGHLSRCLALAAELRRRRWRTTFAVRPMPEGLSGLVRSGEHTLMEIPNEVLLDDEVSYLRDRAPRFDLVLTDHYGLSATWHRQALSLAPRVAAIDDLASEAREVQLLINQNLGFHRREYQDLVPAECVLLLGPSYALLGREFLELRQRSVRVRTSVSRILVFMSASDSGGLTRRITEALLPLDIEMDVVVGWESPEREQLAELAARHPHLAIHAGTKRMAALMADADLAVGAPGNASWERCAMGLPTVLLILAPNQERVAVGLHEAGAALVLGSAAAVTDERLASAVERLRTSPSDLAEMSSRAAATCDAKGVIRVADALEQLVRSPGASRRAGRRSATTRTDLTS